LHVTGPDAPLADRIAAQAAMAFVDLIRADALGRLRICAAEDCEDVVIDLSKNSSKRYCDTGNCGNRTNVAAYRARRRGQSA
jgi:predicted RNA-binding Zn ribbon-like protein